MSFKARYLGQEKTFKGKVSLFSIAQEIDPERKYVAARVNRKIFGLTHEIKEDSDIEFLDLTDVDAVRVYEAGLRYVAAMAFSRVYPNLKVRFFYNISRAVSIDILNQGITADKTMLWKVRAEMKKIIEADYPINLLKLPRSKAVALYKERDLLDKLEMLKFRQEKTVRVHECDGYYNYLYQKMVPSTGYLKSYVLRLYGDGFILQYPRAEDKGSIPPFEDAPTFGRVLKESHDWAKLIGASTVSGINKAIEDFGVIEFINLAEARHNRMLSELGQKIQDNIKNIRIICIAGPSSSGKTTFANRLRVELMSRGIKPIRISIDDYYKPHSEKPRDEDGNIDFESIDALDLERFNHDMLDLMKGKEVTLPRYVFELGHSVPGRTLSVKKGQPIIIEGIHALNERMTALIPKKAKFRIFVAPQIQMSIDDHAPMSLTDLRLIRRLVRDYQFRKFPAEETLSLWSKVRNGEFKWIYPTQEGSDFVYNTMLPYELPVMKKYALPLLLDVKEESPNFPAAERLIRMLTFFTDMDDKWVPSNSLIREFIGGSCFEE